MTRHTLLKIICGLALDHLHNAVDWFDSFVTTRPNLYMTFLVLYIFFALGIAGGIQERDREAGQTIIAESK